VVTRPTLSTQARMFSPTAAMSQERPPAIDSLLSGPDRASSERPLQAPSEVANSEPVTPTVLPEQPTGPVERTAPPAAAQGTDLTVYERDEKITTTRFHIVQKDETLSAISQQYYGTANQWRKILEANKLTVTDANKIRPGTKLIIP
jgi:5'-nucleotidase/UDP-sugar diphosphatase